MYQRYGNTGLKYSGSCLTIAVVVIPFVVIKETRDDLKGSGSLYNRPFIFALLAVGSGLPPYITFCVLPPS